MLSVNALDFINYKNALKGNYRKGVHAFRSILANPAHAADFAANLGGVSLVLGVPVGQDDRNSQQLLTLLLDSSVLDQATLTWMSQWYPDHAGDWDTLAADMGRAIAMASSELMWRSIGYSPVTAGKVIATLGGQACAGFADINALVASQTAMAGVAASSTAMAAVAASSTAMAAVAASQTAMAAVAASATARSAVIGSSTAKTALHNSPLLKSMTSSANVSSVSVHSEAAFIVSISTTSSETRAFTIPNALSPASASTSYSVASKSTASVDVFAKPATLNCPSNNYTTTVKYIPC